MKYDLITRYGAALQKIVGLRTEWLTTDTSEMSTEEIIRRLNHLSYQMDREARRALGWEEG